MSKRKTEDMVCPNCGSMEVCSEMDMELDASEDEGGLFEFLTKNCECESCGRAWSEFFKLTYIGYYDTEEGQEYNEKGEEM